MKKGTIRVIGGTIANIPKDAINTTSRSNGFGRQLSPFFLPGGKLYGNYVSHNLENLWQFSKVYRDFVDDENNPLPGYFVWARLGWAKERADRYPMGRGAKPEYAWWDGKKLSYLEARRVIYIPCYARAVVKTSDFRELQRRYDAGEDLVLWDFDGYNKRDMTYNEVIDNPKKPMGHAFVIAMLLEGKVEILYDGSVVIHPDEIPEQEDSPQQELF